MNQELPIAYNPKETEGRIYGLWEESGFFNPDHLPPLRQSSAGPAGTRTKPYCITVPPPNVTGSLHMGHALNAVIQDILIRKKRMEGYKTLWLPGTDHAGIATQNVVEKNLKKQGLTRHDLGREKFLEKVWEWKRTYGDIILGQFKKLGASMDWSRTRFTMDERYQKAVSEAFLHYYKKGLLYKAEKVINWCTKDQTSLSDLEIEYREEKGKLYFIKYPLAASDAYVVVATTRPETMLGDSAVAVNPNDERYKKLIGRKIILPIQEREIPIIADEEIDMEFGTGAVKVTPAHDLLDARIGEKHNLPIHTVIGPLGKMTQEAGVCAGMKIAECREKVIALLSEKNLIEKTEDYTHNLALCYRCGGTIEPLPSMQWFLKMDGLAQKAIDAVEKGEIVFHPRHWEKVYRDWLMNIHDWNISRQIWWGHHLPVFYCSKKRAEATSGPQNGAGPVHHDDADGARSIRGAQAASNTDYIVSAEKPETCPFCKTCTMHQADDVLDTWFSSALWPFAALGWPSSVKMTEGTPEPIGDLKVFYPTAVLSTARDIINLWVARMIFSGLEFTGEKPFSDVIIHATILTKDGKRMSKSLGTGIDPMNLIETYGADATRFGLIWQNMGTQDIRWAEEHVMAGKKFANKLWNIARFILAKTDGILSGALMNRNDIVTDPEGNAILEKCSALIQTVSRSIEEYNFGYALHALYDFAWHDLADVYIEQSKTKNDEGTKQALAYALANLLKLLHPFMPFITEEIWGKLPIKGKQLLIVEPWPEE